VKISFYCKYVYGSQPCGVSLQVHRLANALVRRGHVVTVYTLSEQTFEHASYLYTYHSLGRVSNPLIHKFEAAFRFLFRVIKDSSSDIVHFHGDDYLCFWLCRRVRTFYGSARSEAYYTDLVLRKLYQTLFYGFELISGCGYGEKVGISRVTRDNLPFINTLIPCCVDEHIKAAGEKTLHPTFLFLGDLRSKRKNAELVLKCFAESVLPVFKNARLHIVGPQKIEAEGVVYEGNVSESEMQRIFRRSWVLVMPSLYEGFGVPVIESWQYQVAVIGSAIPAFVYLNDSSQAICIAGNGQLGEKMKTVITDAPYRKQLVENGSKAVKDYYSDRIASKYEDIYAKVAGRAGK